MYLVASPCYATILASLFGPLSPKIVLPTLTSPLPMAIAPSKSSLIPMLSSSLFFASSSSPSSFATASLSPLSATKSSFSFSGVVATLRAMAPMVMRPSRLRFGHVSSEWMNLHSDKVSAPGAQPDLDSSPEVLTWTWTLSFPGGGEGEEGVEEEGSGDDDDDDERSLPRCSLRMCAFFWVSTLETQYRLGILARVLQWPVWFRNSLMCQQKKKRMNEQEIQMHGFVRYFLM